MRGVFHYPGGCGVSFSSAEDPARKPAGVHPSEQLRYDRSIGVPKRIRIHILSWERYPEPCRRATKAGFPTGSIYFQQLGDIGSLR